MTRHSCAADLAMVGMCQPAAPVIIVAAVAPKHSRSFHSSTVHDIVLRFQHRNDPLPESCAHMTIVVRSVS